MKKALTILIYFLSISAMFSQEIENYSYKLNQSNQQFTFWTTLPCEKVFKDSPVPTEIGSEIKVYAAKNEFEPFQIIVRSVSADNINVQFTGFAGIDVEFYQVGYVNITETTDNLGRIGFNPDPLIPFENNTNISVAANENTAIWVSLFISPQVVAGDYSGAIVINSVSIPVSLHVFNFAISEEPHVKSQMNFSHNAVLEKYGVSGYGSEYWMYVDKMKQYFIDHRLTPKSALWSGGLTTGGAAPYITYDCNGNFTDNDGIWGVEYPADRYLNGNGFNNGVGFPSFMAATFKNNNAAADQRPDVFCDITRTANDWLQSINTPYNQDWFEYIAAIENYLQNLGYLDKAYYYFANEPNSDEAYNAVAWYSQAIKAFAPNFKLAVSEMPRPEIYDNPNYPNAKIDIWIAALVANNFNPEVSLERLANHDEETWIYFLHSTNPPLFSPITIDHAGIESKLLGWFLWKYRIRGIAYYSMNNWSENPWEDPYDQGQNGELFMLYPPAQNNQPIVYGANNHRFVPSIRFELMREAFEDYEYFYILNNNQQPAAYQENPADMHVNKIISGLTAYTRNANFMYNLRRYIGLYNGGEISQIPDLEIPSTGTPENHYINFQGNEPTAEPLIVGGNEYQKIGWQPYSEELGYGWFGDMAHVMSRYLSDATNELKKSILYDDWGRLHTFNYNLANGNYQVTVCVGWQGRTYNHNKITIEGVDFINDEATTESNNYYIERSLPLQITDGNLTMEMGIFDEYTMLNYLIIESLETAVDANFASDNNFYVHTFPNPVKTACTFVIETTQKGEFYLEIFDISGQLVKSFSNFEITDNKLTIDWDTENTKSGLYMFKAIFNDQKSTGKILKIE